MLALFAGQGRLPVILTQRLAADNSRFGVFQMRDHPFENPDNLPVQTFRIEQLGSLIDQVVSQGYTSVCFAGSIARPSINPDQVDQATLPLVERLKQAIGSGDDGALRLVLALFTERGLTVQTAQEIAPELLPAAGVLTKTAPDQLHLDDLPLGWNTLTKQGQADLGQACVISHGRLLAKEDQTGTDAMLASSQSITGGFLFKGPKPDQDRRVDMPTIGVNTVAGAIKAGLQGIVVARAGVLILDLPKVIAACDKAELFLLVTDQP